MWQYFKSLEENKDLFDNLTLPDGIDKDTLMENILLQGGEFEVMYGDPWFMRDAIGTWSRKWQRTFEKWLAVLNVEYNPLENYDRIEAWTDTMGRGAKTHSRRDSGNTRTFDNTDAETIDTTNERTLDTTNERTLNTTNERTLDLNDTTENKVSAFDSSDYQAADKSETDNTGTDTMVNTGTDTMSNTGTDTVANTGTDTFVHSGTIKDEFGEGASADETENKKDEHDGRVHGNIGTMTSQKMLSDELEVQRFNLIEQITDLFVQEFCILVYE